MKKKKGGIIISMENGDEMNQRIYTFKLFPISS